MPTEEEEVQQVETEAEAEIEAEIVDAGTRLLDTIQARDTPQTLALLKQGAPIWFQEQETGWSALHFAAHYEDVELVEMLIERGAIWNASAWSLPSRPQHPILITPGYPM
jgi:hypothetical protein